MAALAAAMLVSCVKGTGNAPVPGPEPENPSYEGTPYITRVLEFCPAPGQFCNQLPEYAEGDNAETMCAKVLEALGGNRQGLVSLGGYGGYVTVGFDHRIENRPGLCDFRVLGNALPDTGTADFPGGNSEPGVVEVAWDRNGNGKPDEDEWYEIAGSAHRNPAGEPWLDAAAAAGNDVETVSGYRIVYYRPDREPEGPEYAEYIRWKDNRGGSGYLPKNRYHRQPYFPSWIAADSLVFEGTRLPQNGVDLSGNGKNFFLFRFGYGYADNYPNTEEGTAIDIDWAVDASGNPVRLPGVDFVRIRTGVHQINGWLGECSTEVSGVTDLHMAGEKVVSDR